MKFKENIIKEIGFIREKREIYEKTRSLSRNNKDSGSFRRKTRKKSTSCEISSTVKQGKTEKIVENIVKTKGKTVKNKENLGKKSNVFTRKKNENKNSYFFSFNF